MYGPAGHTHNGIDANHNTHNEHVGANTSGTLGEFVSLFPTVWTNRPPSAAVVCDVQLDFDTLFKDSFKKLAGFTNTKNDHGTAQAFRIRKNDSGVVEVRWQPRACVSEAWLGADGTATGRGFVIKKYTPTTAPALVPPKPTTVMKTKDVKRMMSAKLKEVLEHEGISEAGDWLEEVAKTGHIPTVKTFEDTRPRGCLGRRCTIGAGKREAEVQMMDETALRGDLLNFKSFWQCPDVGAARSRVHEQQLAARVSSLRPAQANVRLRGERDGEVPPDTHTTSNLMHRTCKHSHPHPHHPRIGQQQ